MKHVRNRLKQLAMERGARRGRYYGVRQIARESGASRTVVDRLMRDELRRLPMEDLARLCVWLGCEPGDLLKLEEEDANG
jgi:DNA-binding Xre family transcriptional regulator